MTKESLTTFNAMWPSVELVTKFLSLYECLSNPEHTELLIETIGNWLSEEDDPLYIESLEQHSQNVLKLVLELKRDSSTVQHSKAPPSYTHVLETRAAITPEKIETQIGISFVAEDITAFHQWVRGPQQVKTFRVVDAQNQGRLCLASKSASEDNTPILEFWLNEAELATIAEELLTRDLGVSNSEILVLREIALGRRRSEIAERLNKSGETIRSQIKSIANKMGVTGQIEIASEMRSLETRLNGIKQSQPSNESLAQTLVLADGRRLDYLEYGPSDGAPILFFHCFLHGKHLPESIEKTLINTNVRVISMARAGFGNSSEHPASNKGILDESARDYQLLVRHLGLGRCVLLAHATGFASAFHFAAKYPELTRKVLGLDPIPPINRFRDMWKLIGLFKAAALTMSKAPATFSLMAKFATRRLETFDHVNKTYRRHILYPNVELDKLESSAGIKAGTQNVREFKINELRQCVAESQVFRKDWSALGPNSNRRPEVVLFHTKNNPFVSANGSRDLATALDSELVDLGETFPFLEPHLEQILQKVS